MAGYVWVAVCHDQVTNVQCWPRTASCKTHPRPPSVGSDRRPATRCGHPPSLNLDAHVPSVTVIAGRGQHSNQSLTNFVKGVRPTYAAVDPFANAFARVFLMRLGNFSGLLTRFEIDILHFTLNISQPNCSTAPMAN